MKIIIEADCANAPSTGHGVSVVETPQFSDAEEQAGAETVDGGSAPEFLTDDPVEPEDPTGLDDPPPALAAVDSSGEGMDAGAAPEGLDDL